ncbi:hypothetical protein J6590_010760 [Homalodisca vitripennis]|nr:hypothetical protein J6590_010760 [Homalodisca vitripennis]
MTQLSTQQKTVCPHSEPQHSNRWLYGVPQGTCLDAINTTSGHILFTTQHKHKRADNNLARFGSFRFTTQHKHNKRADNNSAHFGRFWCTTQHKHKRTDNNPACFWSFRFTTQHKYKRGDNNSARFWSFRFTTQHKHKEPADSKGRQYTRCVTLWPRIRVEKGDLIFPVGRIHASLIKSTTQNKIFRFVNELIKYLNWLNGMNAVKQTSMSGTIANQSAVLGNVTSCEENTWIECSLCLSDKQDKGKTN